MPLAPMSPEWQASLAKPAEFDPVPESLSGVNAAFVDAALRRLYGAQMPSVSEVDVEPLSMQGLMSQVALVTVRYEGGAVETDGQQLPTELIAKAAMAGQETQQAMGFANERAFYTEVPTDVWSARPTVYFCQGTMMLLQRLPGSSLDVFAELPEAQLRKVMSMLARLHARMWRGAPVGAEGCSEATAGATLMPRRSLKPMLPLLFEGAVGSYEAVWKVFHDAAAPEHRDALMPVDFSARLEALFDHWYPADCPDTLVLGDIKSDNMFVLDNSNPASPEMCLIDFQGCGWGPAAADMFFLCMLSQTEATFAARWEEWLKAYYEELTSCGVDKTAYTWEQCRRHFRNSVSSLLISACILAKKLDGADAKSPHHEREMGLSKMLVRKWAAAMCNLGLVEEVAALPAVAKA